MNDTIDKRGVKRKQVLDAEQNSKRKKMSSPSTPTTPATPSKFGAFGSNSKPVAKKAINIKPLKVKPTIPDDFAEKTWLKLREAVQAVFKKSQGGSSQEELYKAVVDMCNYKKEGILFDNLRMECENHVKEVLHTLLVNTPDYATYLTLLQKVWEDYQSQMLTIRSIFLYLDRTYVMSKTSVRSLWDLALLLFRNHVIKQADVGQRMLNAVLHQITRERNGDLIERSVIRTILRMLVSLQIYEESFEKVFLQRSKEFYELEGNHLIETLNIPEYLCHVELRLRQETERAVAYLALATKKPLNVTVEKQLIENHAKTLVSKGFNDLIANMRIDDLQRFYTLFSSINHLHILKDTFAEYIRTFTLVLISDEEKDKTMVEDMLVFKESMDQVLSKAFRLDETFKFAMRSSLEKALNSRHNKPAELIAKFIHSKLQSGSKAVSDDALEKGMDDALVLFRFIDGKDVFEAFYKKDLAKRLLLGRSASNDAEKAMITKLKAECGSVFTSKLEGMLKDIDLSKDIMSQFQQSKDYEKLKGNEVELNVTVITSGHWPPYTPTPVVLPPTLAPCLDAFTTFYTEKYTGRVLKWQHSLGQCTVRASFPRDKIKLLDILKATGIEDKELKRTMQSLALGKFHVLLKLQDTTDVTDEDIFFFNKDFENPMFRIRINSVQMRETVEEQEQTTEKVLVERQYQIDAAVVRIMKARKQLTHQDLMREVLAQLRFPTKGSEVKKRIESLIDRDYLERVQEQTTTLYKYLA